MTELDAPKQTPSRKRLSTLGGIVPKPKVIHSIREFRETYWTPELRHALEEATQPTKTIVIIPRKR